MLSTQASLSAVVVDDHPLYRYALEQVFAAHAAIDLTASFASGLPALDAIRAAPPDLAMLDMHLPDIDAIEMLRRLRDERLPTAAVVLSGDVAGANVYAALEAGAVGYISKDVDGEHLCSAALAAARGEMVLAHPLQQSLAEEIQRRAQRTGPDLSAREREILDLVAEGMSAAVIGGELHLSQTTVKSHLSNIYAKLGVSTQAAAVAHAMQRGLIGSGTS